MPDPADLILIAGHIVLALGFLLLSFYFKKNPPKTINSWYGYRTHSSTKNQNTWDEANRFSGQTMVRLSILYCLISLILYFKVGGQSSFQLSGMILAALSVSTLIFTEVHLKKMFDKEGKPKQIDK